MIVEYLERLYQEMYEQRLTLERENQKKEVLLKDNIKFVQTLENSLDENYESFSPRKVDEENHIKIESLLEEQRKLEEDIRKGKIEIVDMNVRMSELESVLKVARENEKAAVSADFERNENQIFRRKILETQEIERQRIARDMHDSVVQNMISLVHKIEICNKIGDVDPIRCKLELRAMTKTVRDIIQDMRNIIYDLRPMSLEDIGLNETIERELSKIQNLGIINVSYEIEGETENLASITALTILRVVQEACNNILKHAKANNINVRIKYTKENVEVSIEDDGIGFDVNEVSHLDRKDSSGVGMSMMRERIYLLSGNLKINSKPGEGTKIVAKVPIVKEDK